LHSIFRIFLIVAFLGYRKDLKWQVPKVQGLKDTYCIRFLVFIKLARVAIIIFFGTGCAFVDYMSIVAHGMAVFMI
jgi:hypothetical protein